MKTRSIGTRARLVAAIAASVLVVGAGAAFAGSAIHARAAAGRGVIATAISNDLGISRQQLRADLAAGQTLAQIAAANGQSVSGLEQAILTGAQARLDQAVSSGLISSQTEQALLARVSARVGTLVNVTHPAAKLVVGIRLRVGVVRVAAQYLGLTPQQLRSEIRSGSTLAQVTAASGKTASGLEQAVQTAVTTRLDRAVAAGRLTSQREQSLLTKLQARLDAALAG